MRGLTASDFPQIKKLADNIYAYEELANDINSNGAFTTNSLIRRIILKVLVVTESAEAALQ